MMNKFLILMLSLFSSPAFAQHAGSDAWLDVDGTFNMFNYSDDVHSQKAQLAGVRGELGFAAFGMVGISIGANYMDGNTDFMGKSLTGSSLNVTTKDYFSDFRALAHFMYGAVEVAGGMATSEWYDNNGSYRQRRKAVYIPVTLTIASKLVYLKLEGDKMSKNTINVMTSDLGGGANDITMQQDSGLGYGAELGIMIPSSLRIDSRIFISYHHWDLDPSTVASDGVHSNMSIGKTSQTMVSAGVGLGF